SPPPGKPRTITFAPATPPELSDQTPGTSFSRSAVLCGEYWVIAASSTVVIAKLASNLRISAPPAVPVVMISSMTSLDASCCCCAFATGASGSRKPAAAAVTRRHGNPDGRPCSYERFIGIPLVLTSGARVPDGTGTDLIYIRRCRGKIGPPSIGRRGLIRR